MTERTWTVKGKTYTKTDLMFCLDIAVELIRDMDGSDEYLPFAIRKVECLRDNFTVQGFKRTVEDLDLIRRKLS
jgi:hypothetical protein